MLSRVVQDPNFVISDINMHETLMDPTLVMPSHMDNLVSVMLKIKNGFDFNVPVGGFSLSMSG
jgi:hypothetical protein